MMWQPKRLEISCQLFVYVWTGNMEESWRGCMQSDRRQAADRWKVETWTGRQVNRTTETESVWKLRQRDSGRERFDEEWRWWGWSQVSVWAGTVCVHEGLKQVQGPYMEVADGKPMIKSTLTHTDRSKARSSQRTLPDSDIHTLQKRHGHMVRGSDRLKPRWGSCVGQGLAKLRIRVQGQ